ncbi:MAG: gas vesicle protein GvpG [Deltaproteobacteria bacterium]|nr:gas vesicle protein GvpG [Deltaproteobacteria bacterium]
MFLVDDLLMAPVSGVLWIFQEIYEAAEQERLNEAENITLELQKLYRSLESGSISEEEFDTREAELLDRLDSIEGDDSDLDDEQEYDEEQTIETTHESE